MDYETARCEEARMNRKPYIWIELSTLILILFILSFIACSAEWNTSDVGFDPKINLTTE